MALFFCHRSTFPVAEIGSIYAYNFNLHFHHIYVAILLKDADAKNRNLVGKTFQWTVLRVPA